MAGLVESRRGLETQDARERRWEAAWTSNGAEMNWPTLSRTERQGGCEQVRWCRRQKGFGAAGAAGTRDDRRVFMGAGRRHGGLHLLREDRRT